ncbi:hypothetical protein DACRYDRAFT_83903 [Dacryopinax primogenitus]|uniref:Microbial-type PARG catalytic domain-containing protein n=1 Tax=Dacryopinax primogenitus (strain DJM 731) TaxID=1858805 RepID=M5FSJ6_DACPD|nr:uncharacterized protein DACRYDRAFT_83903 [Dacryopinax primogenitus]EJT98159.1 hypothetical protein DACRYDRAFT_83903 [Dacryopinax primogenitus]
MMKQSRISQYFQKESQDAYYDSRTAQLGGDALDPRIDPGARRVSSSLRAGQASPYSGSARLPRSVGQSPALSPRDPVSRSYAPSPRPNPRSEVRDLRCALAEDTLNILRTGVVRVLLQDKEGGGEQEYMIRAAVDASVGATEFLADDDPLLQNWEELSLDADEQEDTVSGEDGDSSLALQLRLPTNFGIFNRTTLSAARELRKQHPSRLSRIGVLNFASATKPGGGFLNGAEAQEESLARSSALYESLMSPQGQKFYELHKSVRTDGFYTHAMIYSPGVVVFRDDDGVTIEPYTVDMVTSPAVNAGVVRQKLDLEEVERLIEREMTERMARILWLFRAKGCRHLVLGSFGTGVFQNNISMVASTWAELLALPHSKFFAVFERVEFAVLGNATFDEFRAAFEAKLMDLQPK